jgi:hypothetical protein
MRDDTEWRNRYVANQRDRREKAPNSWKEVGKLWLKAEEGATRDSPPPITLYYNDEDVRFETDMIQLNESYPEIEIDLWIDLAFMSAWETVESRYKDRSTFVRIDLNVEGLCYLDRMKDKALERDKVDTYMQIKDQFEYHNPKTASILCYLCVSNKEMADVVRKTRVYITPEDYVYVWGADYVANQGMHESELAMLCHLTAQSTKSTRVVCRLIGSSIPKLKEVREDSYTGPIVEFTSDEMEERFNKIFKNMESIRYEK